MSKPQFLTAFIEPLAPHMTDRAEIADQLVAAGWISLGDVGHVGELFARPNRALRRAIARGEDRIALDCATEALDREAWTYATPKWLAEAAGARRGVA